MVNKDEYIVAQLDITLATSKKAIYAVRIKLLCMYIFHLRLLQLWIGQNAWIHKRLSYNDACIRIQAEMQRAERHRAEIHCTGICRRWNDFTEPNCAESERAETNGVESVPNPI